MAKGEGAMGRIVEAAKVFRENIKNVIQPHREVAIEAKARARAEAAAKEAGILVAREKIANMHSAEIEEGAVVVGGAESVSVAEVAGAIKEFETGESLNRAFGEFKKKEEAGEELKKAFDEFEKK